MKPSLVASFAFLAVGPLRATPPHGIDIKSSATSGIELTARDRSNGSWILQGSTDLVNWTDINPAVDVRNSVLPLSPAPAGPDAQGPRYFRLVQAASTPVKTIGNVLDLPETPYDYSGKTGLLLRETKPAIDNKKATLGRVLFYDRRLSLDNSVSCASCHRQEHGFADGGSFSSGHVGTATVRNSQSLLHVRTYSKDPSLFWDGRSPNLESAVLQPIVHPDEMGLSLEELSEKVAAEPYYQSLFTSAFGSPAATPTRVAQALSDFIEAMPSFSSKYDTSQGNLTQQEQLGRSLFNTHCATCHTVGTGAFTNGLFMNNGLDLHYSDTGRAQITHNPQDEGKFRVPSLRDVAVTAPYMHDGRFQTLRQVIDFYSNGVSANPYLSSPLTPAPKNFTESEKFALEAFLKTLTDETAATNPAFSDPFRKD